MSKEMVISANPHETRVAIMEEGQLCEYYVEREKEFALVGSIYKGRVTRVLPGMQSAFVDIGLDSDAFLYVTDFLEDVEELDHIVTTVVDKVQKMEDQGGQVFAADNPTAPAFEPADVESAPVSAPVLHAGNEAPPAAQLPRNAVMPAAPATYPHPIPASNASAPETRFENRNRQGRDFGRRGGRRGGRFARPSSGGAGRGGDPRYGRELPPSKYASTKPSEDHSSESAPPPDGSVPVVLPGESLAKYREKPPGAASASTAARSIPLGETPRLAVPASVPEPTEETVVQAPPSGARAESRTDFRRSSSASLEPLPGETLSKWQPHEPVVEKHPEAPISLGMRESAPADPDAHEDDGMHNEDLEQEAHQVEEAQAANEEHAAAELSEDEAATLAEHVAEAQIDEEAREAQRRDFTALDEVADISHAEEIDDEVDAEAAADAEEQENDVLEQIVGRSESDGGSEAEDSLHSSAEAEHAELPEQAEGLEAEALPGESAASISSEDPLPQNQQPSKARLRDDYRARMQHPARRGRERGRRDDRGRRPPQGPGHAPSHHRPQFRRPQLIADMLKQGQEIIVQIAKEPLGKKGARITSHVALPGRFLVYMPTLDHTGVSRKIASAEERARLRHLVNEAKGSAGGGFIVRTAAASAPPEDVRADVEFLTRTWSEIKSRSEQRKAPSLLHRDLNLVERILRDYMSSDYAAIWVDSEEEFTKVVDFMSRFQPQLVNRVKLYTKETPVFEEFGIQQEIDKGLRPKVWLKSGGYIVINHTEALVAIDVNTGKFVGKGSNRLEDTIVRTNLEAVKEIVRQMRLRDLGGIIIIDFIDMEERRNREKVMAALEDALKADRAPSKMLRFNEFGLIAITRKRTKQALERTLCQPCPYCTGSGMVKSIPTLCYEIQTEARKMAPEVASGSLTLRVHPEISKALKTRESSLIEELEHWTKKSIIIQADPALHWEQYDIY
jgi:Rne/Rng family ribonuclease